MGFKTLGLFLLMLVVNAEAQTFQYSRGWTNGKRSGGNAIYAGPSGTIGSYDLEAGLMGNDPMEVIIPPGHLISQSSQPRFRSLDYNQFLVKRAAVSGSGNARKPVWFGTIVDVDASETSGSPSSSSNSSPSTNSRSPGSDF